MIDSTLIFLQLGHITESFSLSPVSRYGAGSFTKGDDREYILSAPATHAYKLTENTALR